MAVSNAKVPAIVASSLICLVLGAGAGVLAMWGLGFRWEKQQNPPTDQGAPGRMGMGGMPGMPGMDGMPPMPGRGGPGGPPNPKSQLAGLVNKLDDVTAKPLEVKLDDKQKKEIAKALAGLAEKEELSDGDADKRLQAILKALTDEQKATLQKAGWMAGGGRGGGGRGRGGFGAPPADVPNPFTDAPNKDRLKSLQKHVRASDET